MDHVYEALRTYGEDKGKWVWTASQSTRGNPKRKTLDLDDVADSLGKVRVADNIITINTSLDQAEVSFLVAKCRHGQGREKTQTLPTDFPTARIAPVTPTLYP
jgi:hypothetical protein